MVFWCRVCIFIQISYSAWVIYRNIGGMLYSQDVGEIRFMADELIDRIHKSKMEAAHSWWTGSSEEAKRKARKIMDRWARSEAATGMKLDEQFAGYFPDSLLPGLYAHLCSAKREERNDFAWLVGELYKVEVQQNCKSVPKRLQICFRPRFFMLGPPPKIYASGPDLFLHA